MDLEINIVTRLIILSLLAMILVRLGFTFIFSLFSSEKKKKGYDLEQMIKNKQDFLRGGDKSSLASAAAGKTAPAKQTSAADAYCQQLKKLHAVDDKALFDEVTAILALFDSVQWGHGPELKIISDKFFQCTHFAIDESTIARAIHQLNSHQLLLMLNSEQLPSLKDLHQVIITHCLWQQVSTEFKMQQFNLISTLAKQSLVSIEEMQKAIFHYCRLQLGEKGDYATLGGITAPDLLVKNNISLDQRFLFKDKRRSVMTALTTIKKWQELAQNYQLLKKIAVPDKGDWQAIYGALSLKPNEDWPTVKRLYKMKAMALHPDKISGIGLTPAEMQVVTENYAIIQHCYDEIKKKLGQ